MSEYWKSTPKYWCKHCSVYVRDTKLERANHEATGKHQGAIKRSLRDLHRGAEQAERDKERAKREVERLNGVVSGSGSGSGSSTGGGAGRGFGARPVPTQQTQTSRVTDADRQRQLEQLAELGVAIPDDLRGHMAMAGEWTVTKTRVIEDGEGGEGGKEGKNEGRLIGVKRERERTEEEREQEEAINGLFRGKKPRRWGVDSKRVGGGAGGEEDEELEALLSGGIGIVPKGKKEEERVVKKEEGVEGGEVKREDGGEKEWVVKKEEEGDGVLPTVVKQESDGQADAVITGNILDIPAAGQGSAGKTDTNLDLNAVGGMFKKRKAKAVRQK